MKFLLNMNLPRSLGKKIVEDTQHQCRHIANIGMFTAPDLDIIIEARAKGEVILIHDLDYGKLLAFSGDTMPSVIIFRPGNVSADSLKENLLSAWKTIEEPLEEGSIVILEHKAIRIRRLPIQRP